MILNCPNCGNRYLIGDHALGEDGRNVRCGNCEHTWHAMPDSSEAVQESRDRAESSEPIPEAVRPVPEHSSLPAVQGGYLALLTRAPGLNGAVASVLAFLIILMPVMLSPSAAVHAWPASAWLYQKLGVTIDLPGDDLALENVRAKYQQNNEGEGGELSIQGRIINLSGHTEHFDRLTGEITRKGDTPDTARRFTIERGRLAGESQKSFSHTTTIKLNTDDSLRVAITPPWQD